MHTTLIVAEFSSVVMVRVFLMLQLFCSQFYSLLAADLTKNSSHNAAGSKSSQQMLNPS